MTATFSATIDGEDLYPSAVQIWSDGSGTLEEAVGFFSITRGTTHASADYASAFSVHLGISKPNDEGSPWDCYLWPVYGAPRVSTAAPDQPPYYTRVTIPVTVGETTVNIDNDGGGAATLIGHGQSIPPTYFSWNPTTGTVSGLVEGHTLAFTQNPRVRSNPNETGFAEDGQFTLRYDHTTEAEGRETFYVMGSYGGYFVASDGTMLRGDVPPAGQAFGFSTQERVPYVNYEDRNAANYPIAHNWLGSYENDHKQWTNGWNAIPYEQRASSGIGPFALNITSRGADYLKDFGMAWLLQGTAARILAQYASPTNPHTRNQYVYNYDSSAMRAKGQLFWAIVTIWQAMVLLASRRTSTTSQAATLRDALFARAADILALLKQDYANNSWIEYRGVGIAWWEAGHYFQGLLLLQEAIYDYSGTIDTTLDAMMRTIASTVHANTLEWINGQDHPRGGSTYNGATVNWALEYEQNLTDPDASFPLTYTNVYSALYEWAKLNGLDTGAKQDAIITQFAGVDYKWKLGTTVSNPLAGSLSADLTLDADTGTPYIDWGGSLDAALSLDVRAAPTIAGGGVVRTGAALAVSSVSIGTAIAVGPEASYTVGTKAFSITRGDDYQQPFTVTLDQSRTLNGSESWTFTVRETKSGPALLTLTSPTGITVDGSFQPTVVFTPSDFSGFSTFEDTVYLFDLEMTKDGKYETLVVDELTIIGDISR